MKDHAIKTFPRQVLQPFNQALQKLGIAQRWSAQGFPPHHELAFRRLVLGLLLGATSIRQAWQITLELCPIQGLQSLYDCLDAPQIDMVKLLHSFVPGYQTTVRDLLVVDDTITRIRGESIAGTTWQHESGTKAEHWGHNVVTLFHRGADGHDRFCDLRLKMNQHQPAKQVSRGRPSHQIQQARRKKWQLTLEMINAIKQRGHKGRFVLCDAGYDATKFLQGILQLDLNFITRLKGNRCLLFYSGLQSATTWLASKISYKRLRDTGFFFVQTFAYLPGVGVVKVVASWPTKSNAGKEKARFFMSSELSLTAYELITLYQQRWGIESGYKECRQVCGFDEGHVKSWHAVTNYYALSLVTHLVARQMQTQSHSSLGVIGEIIAFRQQVIENRILTAKQETVEKCKMLLWKNEASTCFLDYRQLNSLFKQAFWQAS